MCGTISEVVENRKWEKRFGSCLVRSRDTYIRWFGSSPVGMVVNWPDKVRL